ncbi:MAG: hypothetical protein KatS3mg114_0609 [Planctomycetaceae bacterium]|nr:MAG: hypothetical protein KatS3mg114_0609 [Planctomycetaceae bacterium]
MRLSLMLAWCCFTWCAGAAGAELPWIVVAPEGKGFITAPEGRAFTPWGFNYDHDTQGRLLEDYWHDEWSLVETHFREMKRLGANVVRIHLQFGRFMQTAETPHPDSLNQLRKLVGLAEDVGLYLDLTGLGCYHKADVPAWYDDLDESARWQAQCRFWEAIAQTCAHSPAIFCYDLMNEPVVPGGRRQPRDWLGPDFAGKHFVQFISLDQLQRPRPEIARQWVSMLRQAIRRHDTRHLITVGLVDWSLDRPGITSGFVPEKIGDQLDFVCVHLYPRAGKLEEALETLRGFDIGKPVVIEETFPLWCSVEEFRTFMRRSRDYAHGWIGFYWGHSPAEIARYSELNRALIQAWLDVFQQGPPASTQP